MVGTDGIDLAEDRDRWRALVNVVMNLRIHKIRVAGKPLASQEGLCPLEYHFPCAHHRGILGSGCVFFHAF